MFENIGMAVATGGILFGTGQLPDLDPETEGQERAAVSYKLMAGIYGALFMTSFHILLGKVTTRIDISQCLVDALLILENTLFDIPY